MDQMREAKRLGRPGVVVGIALTLGFAGWAVAFILKSSLVGIDGRRYFALFDDAMISMRYAWNLAHGHGLVWNVGERVEGYTSLLMVLTMTPFSSLIRDKSLAVLGVQLLGLLVLVAIAFLSRSMFRRLVGPSPNRSSALLESLQMAGTLWCYPLAFFTLMGMETGLLTFLLLAAVVLAFRAVDERSAKDLAGTGAVLGLAFLARPDTLVFAAVIYAWMAVRVFSQGSQLSRFAWAASLAVFVLFPLAQLAFRWLYYGEIVPNTYVLKVEGFPLMARLQNGLAHIRPFMFDALPMVVLAAIALTFNFSRKGILLASLFLSSVAYTVWVGGDAWRLWRWIAPTMPLVLALVVQEAAAIVTAVSVSLGGRSWEEYASRNPILVRKVFRPVWAWTHRKALWLDGPVAAGLGLVLLALVADAVGLSGAGFGEEQVVLLVAGLSLLALRVIVRWATRDIPASYSKPPWLGVVGLVAMVVLSMNQPFLREMTFLGPPTDTGFNSWLLRVAQAVDEVTSEQATIGVASAGVIPYYSGRKAVDFLGKTDPHIARLPADTSGAVSLGSISAWPGHNKYDLDYSIGVLRPTYVQVLQWGADDLCYLLETSYIAIDYRGVRLFLLRDSPEVDWRAVFRLGVIPPAEEACGGVLPRD